MASNQLSRWRSLVPHVLWHEHCAILSNIRHTLILPAGNGVDISEDERFHLSLLNGRVWSKDNFWYLAFLPKFPSLARDPLFEPLGIPFPHLPILQREDSLWIMRPSLADKWIQLEFYLVATFNLVRDKFLQLVPVQTVLPPYPRSTNYHGPHGSEEAARRAAHRARRLFLGWLCLLAAGIASSAQSRENSPPLWYRTIAQARPAFPPFWLDKITSSPILTDFSPACPRRGLVVNMRRQWGFMEMMDVFRVQPLL